MTAVHELSSEKLAELFEEHRANFYSKSSVPNINGGLSVSNPFDFRDVSQQSDPHSVDDIDDFEVSDEYSDPDIYVPDFIGNAFEQELSRELEDQIISTFDWMFSGDVSASYDEWGNLYGDYQGYQVIFRQDVSANLVSVEIRPPALSFKRPSLPYFNNFQFKSSDIILEGSRIKFSVENIEAGNEYIKEGFTFEILNEWQLKFKQAFDFVNFIWSHETSESIWASNNFAKLNLNILQNEYEGWALSAEFKQYSNSLAFIKLQAINSFSDSKTWNFDSISLADTASKIKTYIESPRKVFNLLKFIAHTKWTTLRSHTNNYVSYLDEYGGYIAVRELSTEPALILEATWVNYPLFYPIDLAIEDPKEFERKVRSWMNSK